MASSPRPRFDPEPPPLPELADLPLEQRAQIWRQVQEEAGWQWLPLLLSLPLVLLGSFLLDRLLLGTSVLGVSVPAPLVRLLTFVAPAAIVWGPMLLLFYRQTQRALWRLVPHLCDGCGYNLTGNTSDRCPECGRHR